MKTKLTRISKRSLAMLLSVLMLVSAFVVMGTVTAFAADYYVAGSFNNWTANGTEMYNTGTNTYAVIVSNDSAQQYKVTNGSWSNAWPADNKALPAGVRKITFNNSTNDVNDDAFSGYTIAGTANLCTSAWAPGDPRNELTNGSITYTDVPVGNYEFKVTKGSWGKSYGYDSSKVTFSGVASNNNSESGQNIKFTTSSVSDVTITFNSSNQNITVNAAVNATPLQAPVLKYNNETTTPVDLYSTSTASLSWAAVTNATSYEVFKDGVSQGTQTTCTYSATSTGSYTVKAIPSSASYSTSDASNAIKVNFHEFYLLGLKNEYDWDVKDANKMTYNSTTGLYEITRNLHKGSTTYGGTNQSNANDTGFKIYDTVDNTYYGSTSGYTINSMSYNNTTLTSASNGGKNVCLTTKDLSSATSSKVTYKFTYNPSNNKVTVYYPMKVTFDKNGHGTAPSAQVVAYGSTATNPGTLTASDGYTHNGKWYTESSCTNEFSFSTAVTEDKNLYAKWTGAQKVLKVQAGIKTTSSGSYTLDDTTTAALTMDGSALTPAGSSGSTYQTKNVAVGDTCTLVAPNKGSGYTFLGWYNGDSRVSTNAQYTYTHTMANDDTTLVARYERKYTLTITAGSNGKVNTNQNSVSKTVFYDDAPDSFTINPNSGYIFDTENNATLLKYYTVSNNSATGKAANSIASADKVDTSITVNFVEHLPVVNFTSYKTDNAVTYTAGGGELTASWTTSSGGSGSGVTYPDRYLWWSASDNPAQHSNKIKMAADTDGNYYANFTTGDNFYFNINDNSSSATGGSQKLNSSTSADKDSNFQDWTTVGEWSGYYIGKGDLQTGTGVYIKFSPSENKVYFKSSAFTYSTGSGSGGSGSGGSSSSGTVTSGGTVPYGANVTFTAEASAVVSGETYQFVGWYSTSTPANNETALSTNTTYTVNSVTSDVTVYARYKKSLYLTFYNSYVQEANGKFTFVAAPPRTVTVGSGSSVRATYSYKAGNAEQRGEENTKNSTSDYYEGNRLLVLVGETVTLKFSTLASSDAITGIFFNNGIRYTTETEPDNLYMNRVNQGITAHGGNSTGTLKDLSHPDQGYTNGDDEWDYTYLPDTTIYADEDYYEGDTKTTIQNNASSYIGQSGMDQAAHTVSWVATQSYMNIDIELGRKYQLHINDDKPDGISIANMNDEGYYFGGEAIESTTADHDDGLKITLDNTTDTSGTYSFTSTTVTWKDKDGNTVAAPSGVTVKAYTSDNAETNNAANVDHFLVYGTMPHSDLYLTIPVAKKYNMKLSNIVVSDNGSNKRTMLTECGSNSTSATDCIGTISGKVNGTTQASLTDDGTYYTYDDSNNAGHVEAYTNNTNNKYLNGGVNRNGYDVTAGQTVTYSFSFNSGKDAEYTFVGWFEGTYNNASDTNFSYDVNYNKKLSGKETFTFTPTKNTVVIAVATRDIYIGGNFTKDGAYTSTESSQTWSKNRPLMDFDPTYVNPEDPSKKGRYTYTFNTVTANTEYKFRCYDTVGTGASGQDTTNLTVWNQWSGDTYANNDDGKTDTDVFYSREKYDGDAKSHGAFMFKNNGDSKTISGSKTSSTNHQTNGYDAPVTVNFYAYDGGISVNSTYQWSKAYVSAGRGIDCTNYSSVIGSNATPTYNSPTVEVAATTVAGGTVAIDNETYGSEAIKKCTVQENNGQIQVTAKPGTDDLDLHAFLVYNIDTKEVEAVKEYTTSGSGKNIAFTGNITVPQNSSLYIVPIYKFTDTFIRNNSLQTRTVYVRTDDLDKDDWGGLVAMYSWGSKTNSGGWPGQLMIPSDDGNSFYGQLAFGANDLSGVTFNNYTSVYGGNFTNFLGTYTSAVSSTKYSSYTGTGTHYINQAYDYREPISIIQNINEGGIYDSEDMDLTFALKMGNKNGLHFGETDFDSGYSFEYLTDRSGNYRVDLNGNKLTTQATETYYVVCNYTDKYKTAGNYDFKDGTRDATSTQMTYGIEWTVYANDAGHTKIGTTKLSAAYTDFYKSEMLTSVAKMLVNYGYPVSGKAVKIAYEDPKEQLKNEKNQNTEAKRFSGQWYADGVNTIIKGNARVGIVSDGAWTPSDTNAPGYATATVGVKSGAGFTIPNSTTGEQYVQEDGCSGNSLVKVTKKHATDGNITYTVSTTDNFLGWYRDDGEGGFEPVGSNYKNQTITPSFNSDITYYAFYSASASYRFAYTSRTGSTKYYTAKGTDLTDAELANSGTLNPTTRSADITAKLAGVNDIKVFNHKLNYDLTSPDTSSPYTITYTAGDSPSTYTLTVYAYNSSGTLAQVGSKNGTWNTSLDVNNDLTTYASGFSKGSKLVNNKPSDHGNYIFLGWRKYNGSAFEGPILSTKENFGYSITSDTTIAPYFVDPTNNTIINYYISEAWKPGVDNSVVTQELTKYGEGVIYNDNLISFRYGSDTNKRIDGSSIYSNELNTVPEGKQCGVVVLAQANDATDGQKTTFNNQYSADSHVQSSVNYFVTGAGTEKSSVKLSSSKYGDAYAFHVKAETLSNLNRANIVQALDYAKFSGGNYKVMSYYYDGSTIVYSDVTSGTLTCSK